MGMQIVIRKRDSVTSILLFLFNVFLVERGIVAVPLRKIFKLLEPFRKNETAIRMGLSRETLNGVLINEKADGEVIYRLTKAALTGFKYWMATMNSGLEKAQIQPKKWDGAWRCVVIGKVAAAKGSEGIQEDLRRQGFGIIGRNLWISAHDATGEWGRLPGIYRFQSRLADDADQAAFVEEIWPIRKLNERYHGLMADWDRQTAALDIEAFGGGGGLPFLHRFGLEFFAISRDDPYLPKALLPDDWAGMRAAMAFRDIRRRILPKAGKFVDRILEV